MDANTEIKQKREPGMEGVHGTNENVCENYFLCKTVKVEKGKGWSGGRDTGRSMQLKPKTGSARVRGDRD